MSVDIYFHNWDDTTGKWYQEASDTAKPPVTHRTSLHNNYPAQNVNGGELEKP